MIDHLMNTLSSPENRFSVSLLVTTIILSIICFVTTKKVVKPALRSYAISKKLGKIANNPKPHWFYGHTKYFGKTVHERAMNVAGLSSVYPLMFHTWRGPVWSSLTFFHPSTAKSFLYSGAPKDFGYSLLRPWLGDGLLTSKGEKWKRKRMLLTPAFHFSILKPYMKVSNQTIQVMIKKWKQKTRQPLEISEDVSMMTLDTMVQCAMSTKTDCQLTEGHHPYISAVKQVARALTNRFRNPLLLVDWIFRRTKHGKAFYSGIDVLHKQAEKLVKTSDYDVKNLTVMQKARRFSEPVKLDMWTLDRIISDRRRVLDESSTDDDEQERNNRRMKDFLDILIQTKDEHGKGLTDKEIRDEVDTFMFEGHDTTSSGISWAIYNLAKYPEFQEKCREEVESVCREQEDVEWEDLNHMPYLTMFLKESMRLYPPVAAVGRQLERPLKVHTDVDSQKEAELPPGATMSLNIIALHRNPLVWDNPEEFNPERFTKDNCARRNPNAYVPFSAGSRNCIGQNFAMNEMKVALSQILRNFKLYLDEETPEPKLELRLILQSEDGIYIKLVALPAKE